MLLQRQIIRTTKIVTRIDNMSVEPAYHIRETVYDQEMEDIFAGDTVVHAQTVEVNSRVSKESCDIFAR